MYSLVSTLFKSSPWASVKRANTAIKSAYWIGYLNEILLRPPFTIYLDLQISSLVGHFKKVNACLVYYALVKLFGQTKNSLECGLDPRLNNRSISFL